jgi:phage shock protein PspC (stress-responsive transcriptional regulator)
MSKNRAPLRRSRDDRVIAGVGGGLGKFFGISPLWFRLAFLLSLLPGGIPGLLIYFILWVIIPNE